MRRDPFVPEVGSIVKHRGAFLRSIGWYTNVPKNGRVLAVRVTGETCIVTVEWCDGETMGVNSRNIMQDGRPDYSNM